VGRPNILLAPLAAPLLDVEAAHAAQWDSVEHVDQVGRRHRAICKELPKTS